MWRYFLTRLARLWVVLLGVSIISFLLLHVRGDPTLLMLPPDATPEQVAEFRQRMGFDRPLHVQYLDFVKGVLSGRFGESLKHRRPTWDVIAERWPTTLQLATLSMLLATALSIPMGMASAVKFRTAWDRLITAATLMGQSMPVFWTGILLITVFGVTLRWLPVSGWGDWQRMIMPTVTLALWVAPVLVRLVRTSTLEVLSQDYIRTARAKGLGQWRILARHVLKNAAIPVVTLMGIEFGRLLGGTVITESVFAVPGIGRLIVESILFLDFPVVQAAVMLLAAVFVVINFAVDLLYAALDPRIRFQ